MTRDQLQSRTKKELADQARKQGVAGWHAMRKEDLVEALAPARNKRKKKPLRSRPQTAAARNTTEQEAESSKFNVGVPTRDLSAKVPRDLPSGYGKDRIVAMVRDPYWLHCYWELTRHAVQRAEAALSQEWHTAKPILRLLDVSSGETSSTSESILRDIEIHGGCNNWYIDVSSPPKSYRVDIGYRTVSGRFYVLARSNVVTTPKAGTSDIFDESWSNVQEQFQRLYRQSGGANGSSDAHDLRHLFEERFHRPMHSLSLQSLGTGALSSLGRDFHFEIDAELIVYGATEPNTRVTLQGEPVTLRPDGTFTVRFSLPDSRQIIPAVAASPDGVEERTIVLAVERNTKELEPMIHDGNEL